MDCKWRTLQPSDQEAQIHKNLGRRVQGEAWRVWYCPDNTLWVQFMSTYTAFHSLYQRFVLSTDVIEEKYCQTGICIDMSYRSRY